MSRYIDADKYMNRLRANINATSDTINEYIKEDDPIGTVKDGGQIGYLLALQWARRALECDCYTVKAITLDRIEEAIDQIGELDIQSIDFHEGTNRLGTSEFVCVDEVLEILNKLVAEVEKKDE